MRTCPNCSQGFAYWEVWKVLYGSTRVLDCCGCGQSFEVSNGTYKQANYISSVAVFASVLLGRWEAASMAVLLAYLFCMAALPLRAKFGPVAPLPRASVFGAEGL